ncbi:MAG: hypothetical protein EXR62_09055 [Chloroflexi bacterium]|nr:hypothetical protein [Chloroflexota bacterium]
MIKAPEKVAGPVVNRRVAQLVAKLKAVSHEQAQIVAQLDQELPASGDVRVAFNGVQRTMRLETSRLETVRRTLAGESFAAIERERHEEIDRIIRRAQQSR